MGNHTQSECRQKCKRHPWDSHRNIDCNQKSADQNKTTWTCHPSRAGKHAEPLWCLFCNTVTPKMTEHRCFHCWKCSTEQAPILSKDCPCPNKFKKQQFPIASDKLKQSKINMSTSKQKNNNDKLKFNFATLDKISG